MYFVTYCLANKETAYCDTRIYNRKEDADRTLDVLYHLYLSQIDEIPECKDRERRITREDGLFDIVVADVQLHFMGKVTKYALKANGMPFMSLDEFWENEIPYRLKDVFNVSDDDAKAVEDEILDAVMVTRNYTEDFVDYERLDNYIESVLAKHNISYERE